MKDNVLYWIGTAPVGAAAVLAEELAKFGAVEIRERSHDVKFQGTLEVGYRACLWSRTATRILLSVGSISAASAEDFYASVRRIDWQAHIGPGATLACDCSGGNESIRHTIYGSQLLKDAVCDSLRDATGERPNIRPQRPDVLLHVHVEGATATVSVDFSGESLHRRGYRTEAGRAPLKENVAAAILLRAGWPEIDRAGGSLLDPMCGSGTFLIEAASIAADAAPAYGREYLGFQGWQGHDPALWANLKAEAEQRRARRIPRRCIVGSDSDGDAVRMAIENGRSAGFADWMHVEKRALSDVACPPGTGLVVANPPYGERIGAHEGLTELYSELGRTLRDRFNGWKAAILTGNPPLARNLGIHAKRSHRFYNGTIECRLLRFDVDAESAQRPAAEVRADWSSRPGAAMFANRLRKNLKQLEPWALEQHIDCFRIYDADMPEYAFAIDLYGRESRRVYVQEYAAPKTVNADDARQRRREVLAVVPDVLSVPVQHVHTRVRKPQKGAGQYAKRESAAERHVVREGGLKFWVNFRDYLDTGLFLDHRLTRQLLRGWAQGADFLNLFCYTGSATVYAAAGGARTTTSVDLSNTYLEWAHENLLLNGFAGSEHELSRADCLDWLDAQTVWGARFDLIFVDPPTFSNS
ncbi:MAG: bifunctional 23S rRNA (guanine(2069)-N(7))-methyltransferase RlmK/23S rRNA (guanine(2445)-N(2))-methyltransferase RlmL, partial [Pseudomonadota bacterium]|nr:bifunctional 23S rRNA (guanine(2069)-N(7))-methyltransferase RlmK/23S rRNA (guanine(2445)-N(2))-methyltransferase RlmL [Pseudomonadota bacterium]